MDEPTIHLDTYEYQQPDGTWTQEATVPEAVREAGEAVAKKKYVALRTRRVQALEITVHLVEGEPVTIPDSLVDDSIRVRVHRGGPMRIVLAKDTTWIDSYTMIRKGQPWDADHPIVKATSENFTNQDPTLLEHTFDRPPVVEEMTAIP